MFIQNPFSEIFVKSIYPCGADCDLRARKEDAVGWIKKWVGEKTNNRLTLGGDGGMDIVYNIGLTNSKTCYAHCSIGAGTEGKRPTRCRIMTPANPEACEQTIISVVDQSPTTTGVNWTNGEQALNREEFREIRLFLSEFQDCKTEGGFLNSTLRGRNSNNVQVGFLDTLADRQKKFGYCVIRADQQGRDANDKSNTKVSAFRQPSGLDALLFATPNPRYGGSLDELQCKDVLDIQQKLCIQKFNDRLREKINPIGIQSINACAEKGTREKRSCETEKIRDACLGITNWDSAEPDDLKDEDQRFGVPDMTRHCVIPAGAQTGITRTDVDTAPEAVAQLASSLPTQVAATTKLGKRFTTNIINLRTTNCFAKCKVRNSSEEDCSEACAPLLLDESIPDSFEGVEF